MRRGLHVWKHAGALPAGALLAALLTSGCAPEKPPAAPPAAGTNAAARTGTAGVTRGFKVPDYDAENKLKSMLSGEEARPLPEERFQILGLHVETYDAAGKPELIVEAPECVFDRKQRVARSAGAMRARSADGLFSVAGEGFEWDQASGQLQLSNKVETTISQALLRQPGAGGGAGQSNLVIHADRLDLRTTTKVAVYTGNVRASDPPDLDLASQSMSVRLETEGSGIRSVEAHEQVVITMREAKGGQRIGRGGQAAFDAVTGDVVLTESPTLETREGTLHADKLYLNRTENRLRATDRVRMELRRETMSGLGRREAGAGRAKPVTIHADAFDFEARANMATYTGNVRVDDLPDSELTARKVTAHMPEGGGGITRIVAEQDVVIHYHEEQNGKRVTRTGRGGRAVYEAAGESVVLTGNPSLETAEGRLSGEQVMLNRKDDRLAAKGRVRMELQQGATTGGKPGDKAIIQADDFEFDSARRVAKYAGNVRVEGLPDMDLACQHMLVHLAAEGGRIERLEADREVVIHYSELVEGKRAVRTATGDKAVYEAVTDTVVLTGNPVLETAEGKLFAQRVRLKRTEKHLAAEGAVRMEMKAGVTGGGNSRPGAAARRKPMTIHADAFEYSAAERVAHYRGNVRVDDLPEMELTCRNMTALVAPSGGGIERIVAEEDVVIDFHEERNGRHEKRTARGRRAVFESAADTVTLTGDPTVQVAEGTLTAEAIIYDRTLQLLRAVGERQIVGDPAVLRERNAARSPVKD